METSLNKRSACLVIFALVMAGCGGGAPYVGIWQCSTDPSQSLEIKRFEEYFIVAVRDGDRRFKRDGTFDNNIFSVSDNNVSKTIALERNGDEITCTNPPNFCHCDSPYKKVKSLIPVSGTATSQEDKQPVERTVPDRDPLTVERTVLDRDPLIFDMRNGGTVRVFHVAGNEAHEKRIFDWGKMKFYYLPQLALTKMADDSFAEVRQIDDEVTVVFRLTARKIDRFELMENIHKAVNPSILSHLVSPLLYEGLTVEVPGSSLTTPIVVPSSDFNLTGGSLELSLSVTSDPQNDIAARLKTANEIATAVNIGSVFPIASFEIIEKLSAENVIEVSWERVENTKIFQDYFGPSGPDYVTASNLAEFGAMIVEELAITQIIEADDDASEKELLQLILGSVIYREPIELSLADGSWGSAFGLTGDLQDATDLVDVVTKIAEDSKNLDDDQWCRKYEDYNNRFEKLIRDREGKGTLIYGAFGLGHGGSSDKNQNLEVVSIDKSEDCGRTITSNQFNYEWTGKKFAPKSIVAYQLVKGATNRTGVRVTEKLIINQRTAKIDLEISHE